MTEAELWELILVSQGNAVSAIGIFISIISGYVAVAYLIGKTLSATQLRIITGLFIGATSLNILALFVFLQRASYLLQFTDETYRSSGSVFVTYAPYLSIFIMVAAIVAALMFMSDSRRSYADGKP